MKTEQRMWEKENDWKMISEKMNEKPQLVLVFSSRQILEKPETFEEVKSFYPESHILMCSTAGEIMGTQVNDNSISITAIYFEKTEVAFSEVNIDEIGGSVDAGKKIGEDLTKDNLAHVLVFSDGTKANGTELVAGLTEKLPKNVTVTGGLVGDAADFKKTVVGLDKIPEQGKIVGIGLYGKDLKIGYGSLGGWDNFGPDRIITKSKNNVLFELDNKPALDLYKEYLGDKAKELPGSGLLFPLSLKMGNIEVVRTLLAVNEEDKSITFAGDMPEGVSARLMKANFERLIDGAAGAANTAYTEIGGDEKNKAQLALLISCVGRKLVLKDRIEEETEAVSLAIGSNTPMTGFYSYGEICPTSAAENQCQLHNQTMTITTFLEV
ncbi:FIST C-terminal domain-containing protein [Patescibacteria group bacterium]|nr:FIST C-terminal domain-containing protein [Patescibacteria group bacterium]